MELKRTNELFTHGIVNLPILRENGKIVMMESRTGKIVPKLDSSSRYLFFEIDELNQSSFDEVMNLYKEFHLPVYVHRSMRGFHFLSVQPIAKELYQNLIKRIKHLNPKCPHVTIRIEPNKWQGEKHVWCDGAIISETFNKDLANLREWMIRGRYDKLRANYRIVKYRQAGTLGDL